MKRFFFSIKYFILSLMLLLGVLPNITNAGLKVGFIANESEKSQLDSFSANSGYNLSPDKTPEYYVGLILQIVFSLIGLILISLIVYSGVIWMTARGNAAKVTQAKDTLIEAIVGLLFIIGAYALSIFLLNIFIN